MNFPNYRSTDICELLGKTLLKVEGCVVGNDSIYFTTSDGKKYKMYHRQDCCECVDIDDVCGEVVNLIGQPLLMAEEISCDNGAKDKWDDSYTWTFYKLATINGYVTIKWYGTSNGYYSESVDFEEVL